MATDYYLKNNQKLLVMVKELHKRGFEKLHVLPTIAPNGLAWRCRFINETKKHKFIASTWIQKLKDFNIDDNIPLTPQELADIFTQENHEFLQHCKGKNETYTNWYKQMVNGLLDEELPYASDEGSYFFVTDYWLTTHKNKIVTLPNEKDYF